MQSIAVDTIIAWWNSPARMVRELFGAEPDPPQEKALELFPKSPRIALQACTGSGKTTSLAWIGWNFLLTRPHPVVGCTSISGDNLKANLWTELARWYAQTPLLQNLFEMTKTEITCREHPKTWKMEARTWARDADANQIGSALRGLHAKYVLWLLDETGAYPDSVLPVCEAIFSGEPTEAHIVQAGNPQRRSGPLWHAASLGRRLWQVIAITADPDYPTRTSRVSIEHARQQIEQWGREYPWVIVNVLGQFPPSDINALIGPDEVAAAIKRYYREFQIGEAPKIIGVDELEKVMTLRSSSPATAFRRFLRSCIATSIRRKAPAWLAESPPTSEPTPYSSTPRAVSDRAGSINSSRWVARRSACSFRKPLTTVGVITTNARKCISMCGNGSSAAARCRIARSCFPI